MKTSTARRRPLLWTHERQAQAMGFARVAGVDEVGLGPLAGPAVAAAVVLPLGIRVPGLNDSKQLRPADRERIAEIIRRRAVAWTVAEVSPEDIDLKGLTKARQRAMREAVQALVQPPDYLLIDAWEIPDLPLPQLAMIKGDTISASIMAASVVAKVYRDALMVKYDQLYPGYGFAAHKGYGTV
ncbi:MAG: ribonuclease HII, partial [Candidatus Dormibacteraceae bacterium]